jgi:hypothetical protein
MGKADAGRPLPMLSSIPRASGPQAAVCACSAAAFSVAAEAVAVCRPPWNSTVTVHSYRWDDMVEYSRKATKARTARIVTMRVREVMGSTGWGQVPRDGAAAGGGALRNI